MRRGTVVVLAAVLFAYATAAQAELQLINNGALSAKEAQQKFEQAWKACSDAAKPGSPHAALVKCINRRLAQYKLELTE
jgi:hypothetical protein